MGAAHLISNGDLGSIILFGSILGWAVFDRISLKHRTDPGGPSDPGRAGPGRTSSRSWAAPSSIWLLGFLFHPWVGAFPAFGR